MRTNLVYKLALYINKAQMTSAVDEIAMFLFEHLNDVKYKSLRELSKDSYISQSSFSKYFKKQNITYRQFQVAIAEDLMEYSHFKPHAKLNDSDVKNILDQTVQKMIQNAEMLRNIDLEHVMFLADDIHSYHRVIFVGSDFSMAIVNILQTVLVSRNIICYTMYDPAGQKYMCTNAKEDDLIIFVSIKQRWYKEHEILTDSLKNSKAHKWLWTLEEDHIDKEKFDDVLIFGKNINEFGYSQLMAFVPFFVELI